MHCIIHLCLSYNSLLCPLDSFTTNSKHESLDPRGKPLLVSDRVSDIFFWFEKRCLVHIWVRHTLFFIRASKFDLKLAVLKYSSILSLFSAYFQLVLMMWKPVFAISCVNWFRCGLSCPTDMSVRCQSAC